MDEGIVQQILAELLSSLEPLETQNVALLQFLKAKGIATDEELAPFLEQAGNASNVRWRAVGVRTSALISSAMKPTEQAVETGATKNKQAAPESAAESDKETPPKDGAYKEEAQKEEPQKKKKRREKNLSQSLKPHKGARRTRLEKSPRHRKTTRTRKKVSLSKRTCLRKRHQKNGLDRGCHSCLPAHF